MSRRPSAKRIQKQLVALHDRVSKWYKRPFDTWPRPTAQRSIIERLLRKVWLFRWERHTKFYVMTGIQWCQSKEYRDRKIARYFPIRNWLLEELPYFYKRPKWKFERVYWWIRHRLPGRYWHHTLKLGLEPGYHDTDTKMLYAVFSLVTDYVEVALANSWCGEEENDPPVKWNGGRSRDAGLRHLDWEINDPECKMGAYPTQADAALIKKEVYLWWVDDRPARIDPTDIYTLLRTSRTSTNYKDTGIWGVLNHNNDKRPTFCSHALEAFYNREDKEMLERAVSILHRWWN